MAYDLQETEMEIDLDESEEEFRRKWEATKPEDLNWLNEQKDLMAANIMQAGLPQDEVAIIIADIAKASKIGTLDKIFEEARLREIKRKNMEEKGRF